MLCLLAQPALCVFDPSWWSRHMDFQVYTIKLQPGFCPSCVLQCFLTFEPTFGMMSCLTLQLRPCTPLCFVCESAHRLRDLLSSLQICKRVVHDILKKVLAICGTVFTFCCGQGPNCRTVVSFGGFILASAPGFLGPSALSKACFTLCFTAVRPLWTLVFS